MPPGQILKIELGRNLSYNNKKLETYLFQKILIDFIEKIQIQITTRAAPSIKARIMGYCRIRSD